MMRAEGIDTVEVDLAPPMMNEARRRDAEKGGRYARVPWFHMMEWQKDGSVYELYAWTCDGGCEASPG